MRLSTWAGLSLLSVLFLGGCAGFWDPLPSTSTTTTQTTLSSGAFYVLNQRTAQIVAYSINSGTLSKIGTYSVPGPTAIAIAPNGNFLYVSTAANGIFVYNIGSGGALSVGNNGQYISSDIASAIRVDATNSWLIDAYIAGGQAILNAIPLNSSGSYPAGATVPEAKFTIASSDVKQMAISPDNKNLFVALGAGGTIMVPFDSSSPFPAGVGDTYFPVQHAQGSDLSVAVDPSHRLFYVGEVNGNSTGNSGGIRFFNYSSLTEATGSPIASGGTAPNAILPDTSGSYVYVANGQGVSAAGNIAWFSFTIGGTTGNQSYSLSTGNTISAGIQPMGLAEDSKSDFVLAVALGHDTTNGGNPDLEAYTMSTGALTAAIKSSTGTDPVDAVAIAALP